MAKYVKTDYAYGAYIKPKKEYEVKRELVKDSLAIIEDDAGRELYISIDGKLSAHLDFSESWTVINR